MENTLSNNCPYLDTIDRKVLDFDFEKLCCVSLSNMNVYACLVCGKYYQGRGHNTRAYTHSLDTSHHVFINLQTLRFYCLPDNYEITDPSLEDIKYVLKPTYTKEIIASLNVQNKMARAYDDSTYFPGVVGLNNIKNNDYCNALSHVIPLRDFFLNENNYIILARPKSDYRFELLKCFGELLRKLWNPKAFRKHVSPHEMLQAVVKCSNKQFQITEKNDACAFLHFILNSLHGALNGTKKDNSSQHSAAVYVSIPAIFFPQIPAKKKLEDYFNTLPIKVKEIGFLCLSLDLPTPPLFRDNQLENIIPQVPLQVLLSKYNGSEREYKTYKYNMMKRFEIIELPEYLIVTYNRFHKNQWYTEKNPTIVNFPITNVDLYDCLAPDARRSHKYTTYDLLANVIHDGVPKKDSHEFVGTYRVQILHQGSQKWFEMQDLRVEEILPQEIVLPEAYIQIWRLNKKLTREQRMNEGEQEPELIKSLIANPFNPQLPPKVGKDDSSRVLCDLPVNF